MVDQNNYSNEDQEPDPDEDFPEMLAIGDIIDDVKEYVQENNIRAKITIQVDLTPKAPNIIKEAYTIFAIPDVSSGEEYDKHFKALNEIIKDTMTECFPDDTVQDVSVPVDTKKYLSNDPDIEIEETNNVIEAMQEKIDERDNKASDNMSFRKIMEMDDDGKR